jgi:hypothetical protein
MTRAPRELPAILEAIGYRSKAIEAFINRLIPLQQNIERKIQRGVERRVTPFSL